MERLVAARSAATAGGRSPVPGGASAGLRARAGLSERGPGGRAANLSGRVGPLAPAATRIEAGRHGASSMAAVAPAPDRWDDRPAFFFDLSCPFSYLVAERVERLLGEVNWVPAPTWSRADPEAAVQRATAMARAARLPLVWPEAFPAPVPRALRAAAYAGEIGAGARFALAALRLAFCGGFDLEKRSVLTDVAAAAGHLRGRLPGRRR